MPQGLVDGVISDPAPSPRPIGYPIQTCRFETPRKRRSHHGWPLIGLAHQQNARKTISHAHGPGWSQTIRPATRDRVETHPSPNDATTPRAYTLNNFSSAGTPTSRRIIASKTVIGT